MMERRMREAPTAWKEYEEKRVNKAVAEHDRQVEVYKQLESVGQIADDWMEEVKEKHTDDFQKKVILITPLEVAFFACSVCSWLKE